jgi:hypothetical protein
MNTHPRRGTRRRNKTVQVLRKVDVM